jgi:hypothetical protein
MCKSHWNMVPRPMRLELLSQYRPGQERDKNPSEAYLAVAIQARNAVAEKERGLKDF